MTELADNPEGPVGYWQLFASEWYVRSGQLHDRMGQSINAEANYRKALARQPHRLSALSGLGRLLLRGRRYEEAVEVWRKVVGLRPASAAMTFQFSRALHRSGQIEQAAVQYLRVVTLDPAHEKAFAALEELGSRLARCRPPAENRDGVEQAARIGMRLLAHHPGLPRARAAAERIAETISVAGSILVSQAPHAALVHFGAALALAPDMLEAQRGAAHCFERLGQADKALAILDRQLQANPDAVEPRLHSERIRASLDDPSARQTSPVDSKDRQALLAHARRLLTEGAVDPAADGIRRPDPQELDAILAQARRLITGEADGVVTPLDAQEREAVLVRARRLLTGEADGAATLLDPQEREAVLARARRLITADGPVAERITNLREREAILAHAHQLITAELDQPVTEEIIDPREREAVLARARHLITGEADGPAAERTIDPAEREAVLARARRLLMGKPLTSATPARQLSPLERETMLASAERLLGRGGLTPAADPGRSLDPKERDALVARARRLVASQTSRPAAGAAPASVQDRDALLARARSVARSAAAPAESPKTQGNDLLATQAGEDAAAPVVEPATDQISTEQLLRSARSAYDDGKLAEAETFYRQILDRDGAHLQALSSLSRLYMRHQRWNDAVGILVRLNILQPTHVEPKRLLARALLQRGQLEAAARAYVDLSILEPDDVDVWQSLGQVQKRLANWPAARVAWARLVEIAPRRLGPRFELAWACHQAGDHDAAQEQLQQLLAREPDNRAALTLLGRIRLATAPEASLTCWSKLAELDPVAVEPVLQIARIHLRQQRLDQAEAAFRTTIERRPGHAEAHASLARIIAERDPEEAVGLLMRWSEQDPKAIAPWLATGRFQARLKRLDLAEPAFRRALDLAPSNLEALTGLGRVLSGIGKVDEALAVWARLVELAPESVEPRLQMARIHHRRHDPEAEEALRSVLSVDPQNREALRHLAHHLGRTRATANLALDTWQRIAELDAAAVFPIAQRGRLLERIGRLEEAEAEYRRALARDARHPMALGDLARFYRVQRRWDEAAEIYRAHMKLDPDRLDVILGLGQCLDRRDRLQEAEELYSRALALDSDNVTALGYRARLLRTRGQVDGAIADFYRICELEPSNADAWHELIFQLAGAEREAEALAALTSAEKALGNTPEAWMVLGRAAAAALFEDRAIAYFERAIAAQPDNPAHRAQLGLHYSRQGVVDGALHHLLDSRDLDAKNVEVAKGLFDATRVLRELGFDHVAMRGAPRTVGEILIPERLFDHVRRIAATKITPYEPVPRSVVAISATLAPGGAERQMVNMLRGLSDPVFGLDLALFCISLAPRLRRNFFLPVLEGTGVEVVSLDAASVENCFWHPEVAPFAELIRHFPSDMVTPIAFWLQEFRRRRPQVVHAWQDSTNLTAVVAALLAGVPRIVLCCRSVRPDNPRRRLRRYMRVAYQAVLDHPAVVLSNNSRAGADDYADWLEMAPERIEVVYNGVDFDRLRVDAEETDNARRAMGIPAGARVLGGVFRMSEEKRPLLWVDVAAAVVRRDDTVHFVVCGDGPMRDEMVKRAAALGIGDRVHLPGAQSNIGSWYRMMDVVMLTSRHEGLPNVLLEAQSLGIPVVAPDVGGMSEVVERGVTGWTVRDADAESLAERVVHCMSDQSWRQVAMQRAPTFVRERFSVSTMLRRNLEVYGIPPDPVVSHDR